MRTGVGEVVGEGVGGIVGSGVQVGVGVTVAVAVMVGVGVIVGVAAATTMATVAGWTFTSTDSRTSPAMNSTSYLPGANSLEKTNDLDSPNASPDTIVINSGSPPSMAILTSTKPLPDVRDNDMEKSTVTASAPESTYDTYKSSI